MDYKSNSNKSKEPAKPKVVKKIDRVVTGEVIVHKKTLGEKIKGIFIEADFKNVARYIVSDVLLPAARNTIVDASTKGIERMMYGETAIRRRNLGAGPRVTYNAPVNRGYRESSSVIPARVPGASSGPRHSLNEFILTSREEADLVVERMNDIIDQFEVASVADLNDLVGFPTSYTDNKWGWIYLGDVQIRQVREGYLIDLPSPEPIT